MLESLQSLLRNLIRNKNHKEVITMGKFKMTKETAIKIVKNPKTPKGLKAYWKKKFKI